MKNSENVLLAFVAGLTAGALVGILFAPHKGSKTRRLIKEEGEKVFDELCDKFEEGIAKFSEIKDEIIQTAKDATADRKEAK